MKNEQNQDQIDEHIKYQIECIKTKLKDGVYCGGFGYGPKSDYYPPEELVHTIELEKKDSDGAIAYRLYHRMTSKVTGRKVEDAWPMAGFFTERKFGVYSCSEHCFLLEERLGRNLTKNGADERIRKPAEDLATLISKETGVSIVTRRDYDEKQ